mmetsp:Transcript_27800/g.54721  ORF Transcript_27800/g.54721 Transcript_27800/m.54721 type:complete len:82 (+) Transcript_27800:573-818(+)
MAWGALLLPACSRLNGAPSATPSTQRWVGCRLSPIKATHRKRLQSKLSLKVNFNRASDKTTVKLQHTRFYCNAIPYLKKMS